MRILYVISKAITFPGAVIKGVLEHVFCLMLGLPVESTRYLRDDEMSGHTEHLPAPSKPRAFLINWLPFLFARFFCLAMLVPALINLFYLGVSLYDNVSGGQNIFYWFYLVLLVLGVDCFANLFPSYEDALHMWYKLYREKDENGKKTNLFWRIVLAPISAILLAGAWLERFGLTTWLAIAGVVCGFVLL